MTIKASIVFKEGDETLPRDWATHLIESTGQEEDPQQPKESER